MSKTNIHVLVLIQQPLQRVKSVAWGIAGASSVGEAEGDVLCCIAMQMRQQLLNAETKHNSKPLLVRLKKDQDSMEFAVRVGNSQNVRHILLILGGATSVPDL